MLIKRKLHWMGARKTGKIHPEKPHRNSQEEERRRERERDSRGWGEQKRYGQEGEMVGKRGGDEKM